jgi:hypothetical protein
MADEQECSRGVLSATRFNANRHSVSVLLVTEIRTDTMVPVDHIQVRPARLSDLDKLALLCAALWPKASAEKHAHELRLIPGNKAAVVLTMPLRKGNPRVFPALADRADGKARRAEPVDDRPVVLLDGDLPIPIEFREGNAEEK